MALKQDGRLIRIAMNVSAPVAVLSFSGTEAVSKLFSFEIELLSESNTITFEQMAGQNVTVSVRTSNGERFFNGMIYAFTPIEIGDDKHHSTYHAVMVPTLRAHKLFFDCRIFQDKTVVEIIEKVLNGDSLGSGKFPDLNFKMDLEGSFAKREYCVQYNESNFDFICRLCEQEGIYFFFQHENGKHTLVFSNKPNSHEIYPTHNDGGNVICRGGFSAYRPDEVIEYIQIQKKLTTGSFTARDYNFKISANDMLVTKDTQEGKKTSKGEIYEYPGGYEKTADEGSKVANIRIQAQDVKITTLRGLSNVPGFTSGCKFTLQEYAIDDLNGVEFVLTSVSHEAKQTITSTSTEDGGSYKNSFDCIPYTVPYRPLRENRRPRIVSSQTAVVTGPNAEEIHTDQYGRVKAQFHWDRRQIGSREGNMSCWTRVSQTWAGGNWGAMNIPRVGQEVIVNYLDGDPDRPIISGRLYNDQKMPPYDLPVDKTKNTLMSSSSKGGGNSNEIRFEDLKGEEEFYTHAAKDQNEVVENNMTTDVKANQGIKVEKNRSLTVTSGNETIAIQKGSRSLTIQSNENHTNSADFAHQVSGNYTLKVSGNITIDAGGIVVINGSNIILNG